MAARVCVLVPAFNEEACIETCLAALRHALPAATVVVVDNASTDTTAAIARRAGVTVLDELRPGKGYAVAAGVAWALARGFDWIALHDADNEYCPHGLARLIGACQQERAPGPLMGVGLREVCLGHVLWRSILANWIARQALRFALRRPAPADILTGARVFNTAGAALLFTHRAPLRGFELETALTRRAMACGIGLVSAPVRYTPRAVCQKKICAGDLLPILKAAWSA